MELYVKYGNDQPVLLAQDVDYEIKGNVVTLKPHIKIPDGFIY